jgi:ADP-heptose:LPS heptosyltransferase
LGDEVDDFADTADVIAGLDLVISVDTSVAHLAGAMGKPVWLLLGRHSDWRWLLHRDDTPWYPTMRLFRMTEVDGPGGDAASWRNVVATVADQLRAYVARAAAD